MDEDAKTVEEAFETVIAKRGLSKELGIPESTVYNLRNAHKRDGVTIKKMREILSLAGYKMVQSEKWGINE